jgi:hypothetical protein
MQPNISCLKCNAEEWVNKSRSLSQIERDSGCIHLWQCKECGLEVLENTEKSETQYISRQEYSPIEFLS